MALSVKGYQALRECIDRIRKADEYYCLHMWDEYSEDGLNGFIDALVDLAMQVEFCTLEYEMPEEERNRLARLEMEEDMREVAAV
jgi:hypothetical protein